MSMTYWCIEGIGFAVDDIYNRIVPEKLVSKMEKTLKNKNNKDFQAMKEEISGCDSTAKKFDLLVVYIEDNYDWGIAEAIAEGHRSILANDDGQGNQYVYFAPMMPWEITPMTPKTEQEVKNILIAAITEVTDMTDNEAGKVIDPYIFEVGRG